MNTGLSGIDSSLAFDGRYCHLNYAPSSGRWLRRRLGRLAVPVTALAGIQLTPPGRRREGRLTLILRPGGDPFLAVAGGMISPDDHPFFVEFAADRDADARRLAAELHSAVTATGVAADPADEFMVEATWPSAVDTYDGNCGFDGRNLVLAWTKPGRASMGATLPMAALETVTVVDRRIAKDEFLWFRAVGERPDALPDARTSERCLRIASEHAEAVMFAAGVAIQLRRDRREMAGSPIDGGLPRGLFRRQESDATGIVLHGLRNRAEFDGATVTLTGQGLTRAIPLPAIDRVELVESRGGTGYVRVHLAGATDDLAAPDPALDVDAVLHDSDGAALEFTLQVTRALQGVTRVPDPDLLRTSGLRPDVGEALARASGRVRTMVRELAALSAALEPGETVKEIELAVGRRVLVFFLTDRHLLSLGPDDDLGGHSAVPLHLFADVRATWDDTHEGNLVWIAEDGDELPFHGIYHPVRFQESFRALRFGAYAAQAPAAAPAQPAAHGAAAAGPYMAPPVAPRTGTGAGPGVPPAGAPAEGHRADVAAALTRARSDTGPFQGELAGLLGVLQPGEPVKELEVGRWNGTQGLLGLTDRRLIFADRDGGLNALALSDIEDVDHEVLFDEKPGKLYITDQDYDSIEFAWLWDAERFHYAIDAMRLCPAEQIATPPGTSAEDVRRRPDVAGALSRARVIDRVSGHGLLLLGAVLTPADPVRELEPAVFAGESGLLALTGRALLFAGPGGLRHIPLTDITGIESFGGSVSGKLFVDLSRGSHVVLLLDDAERFEAAIGAILSGAPLPPAPAGGTRASGAEPAIELSDVNDWLSGIAQSAERLTPLAQAYRDGLLTDEEFNAKCAGPLAEGKRFEAAVHAYLSGAPVPLDRAAPLNLPGAGGIEEVRTWIGGIRDTVLKLAPLVQLRREGLLTEDEFMAKCAALRRS